MVRNLTIAIVICGVIAICAVVGVIKIWKSRHSIADLAEVENGLPAPATGNFVKKKLFISFVTFIHFRLGNL